MNLTKRHLGKLICNEVPVVPQDAEKLISDFFNVISEELEQGNLVKIKRFGCFGVIKKSARPGRNPKTGEVFEISERKVCIFKPGVLMKNAAFAYGNKND